MGEKLADSCVRFMEEMHAFSLLLENANTFKTLDQCTRDCKVRERVLKKEIAQALLLILSILLKCLFWVSAPSGLIHFV